MSGTTQAFSLLLFPGSANFPLCGYNGPLLPRHWGHCILYTLDVHLLIKYPRNAHFLPYMNGRFVHNDGDTVEYLTQVNPSNPRRSSNQNLVTVAIEYFSDLYLPRQITESRVSIMLWWREFNVWDCPFAQGNDLRAHRATQCPN